jgi:uncharacterized RDD family membrane protein YckC
MKNKPTFKRICAYIIDIVLISFVSSMFASIEFINPKLDEYNQNYEEYRNYVQNITSGNETLDASELLNGEEIKDLTYNIASSGVITSEITLIISILYFIVFQYFNNGKTVGKALLKIQVKSNDNKKLKLTQIILRSIVINSLLTSLISIICLLTLSKSSYLTVSNYIQIIDMAIVFVTFGMVMFREDGRGLHDILAKTIVVPAEEVKEAVIVKEKKGK